MKTQQNQEGRKSGGVLVMVMVVLIVFSVLALGLFKLHETNAIEVVNMSQTKRAFWEAESGLLDAVQRLRFNETFRNSAVGGSATFSLPDDVTVTPRYDVTVTDTGAGNPIIDQHIFDIESVGWVGGMNRRVLLTVDVIPGLVTAIMAQKNINIRQNTLVSGPISVMDGGSLTLDDKIPPGQSEEGDYDIVILGDGSSVHPSSGASEGEHYDVVDLPVPGLPVMPDFSDIMDPALALPTNAATGVNLGTIDLGGTTNHYNVPAGITIEEITGSGVIVNTGDITITQKSSIGDVDVVNDVWIMSFDDVDIGQKNDFSGDTLVYAGGEITFDDHSIMSQQSALLADGVGSDGGILMGGHSQFEGIVFADEGDVTIQQGSNGSETRIRGTVIGGEDVYLNQNSEIIFDRSVFNEDMFDLSLFFESEATAETLEWEELPPLP